MDSNYLRGLKHALTGDPNARFVFLCNFEVEHNWAHNYIGLPGPKLSASGEIVRRMEELGALLAGQGDVLCLGEGLDPAYRAYLSRLGFSPPDELVVPGGAGESTSQRILASPIAMARLRELGSSGAYLMPMGTSPEEQKVAEQAGLALAVPDSQTMERVNGKIYGRRVVDKLGIRPVPGTCCETVDELAEALAGGEFPVIVKESYGVSGKGLLVVDGPAKAARLIRMAEKRAAKTGTRAIHVVVERFLPKKFDLNYQFTVGTDGTMRFDFVKRALTSSGVHLGHLMPAELSETQHDELRDTAGRLAARLFADGFTGVVGVDAILGADDTLYPVLEINARLNMSSYQGTLTERLLRPGGVALSKHYPLAARQPVSFGAVTDALGPLLEPDSDGSVLVVSCFGTVNPRSGDSRSGEPDGTPVKGRLYATLFAPDRATLSEMDDNAARMLAGLEENQ